MILHIRWTHHHHHHHHYVVDNFYILGGLVDVIIGYGSRLHLLLTLPGYPPFCLNIIIIILFIIIISICINIT